MNQQEEMVSGATPVVNDLTLDRKYIAWRCLDVDPYFIDLDTK